MNDAIGEVLSRLGPVKKSPNGWEAKCPAKDHGPDKNPSLSVSIGAEGRVLMCCHKGCHYDDIRAGIDMAAPDLAGDVDRSKRDWTPVGDAVATYDYVDEAGALLFQVVRGANKRFAQRRPDRAKAEGWTWRLGDVRRVLYRLPAVLAAVGKGRRVLIVEGERDVQAAESVGEVGTCNPGGAGKWRDEYAAHLAEAEVVVVADRDAPGQAHARTVAESLRPVAMSVTVCEAKAGKDLADHLEAGWSIADLEVTCDAGGSPATDLAPDVHEFLAEVDSWDWCVPGLLERGERLMLTGGEGSGKTTWCRQLAVTVAAGLHPFTMAATEPRKVLLIDCENPRTQTRRELRPLVSAAEWAGHPVPAGGLRVLLREGIDLTTADDSTWLAERVTAHRPDVLLIGPLYQLHAGDPNEERPARAVASAIDRARTATNCAVVIEAHAGHGTVGKRRDMRPTGTSFWKRWVSYGYGLSPVDKESGRSMWFEPWRGDRDVRAWPDRLDRGNPWPWEGVYLQGPPKAWEAAG